MNPKKRNTASGVITFHTPFNVSLLKSQECMADLKDTSESKRSPSQPSVGTRSTSRCVRARKRDEASPSGPQQGPKQDRLSYTTIRRLQAKMEAENQQRREIIQPLVDTENVFLKELESFLNQRDVAELRRRELLHKHWTERVWMPLQRRVEQRVSGCTAEETNRRQSLYSHYLHHCNSKGFVFLDTGDLREYNPFLNVKNKHYFKFNTAELKDSLYLQLHERLKEKRTTRSCEAGYKYTSREVEKLPQSDRPLTESVIPQASTLPQASSYYIVSTSRQTPLRDETDGRKSSRLDTIPLHIRATAKPDGRCHHSGCWSSR
ncbi:protein FAM228A isoform X1 [Scomber scombrus]|uniref:Protein FAM228A isoform X1 n=1 Tax=Scomber scombrus TaxID=13677 RepID=A0AAV1NRJ2_SCOSC